MGGVIIILTREMGMGERLMNGIPARYRVILVEHLGSLFFDGRRSCTEGSFAGLSGLYCGDFLTVVYLYTIQCHLAYLPNHLSPLSQLSDIEHAGAQILMR